MDSSAGPEQKAERHCRLMADPSAEEIETWREILGIRSHGGLAGPHFNEKLSPHHFEARGCVTTDADEFESVVRCAWLAAVEALGQSQADDLAAGVAAFSFRGFPRPDEDAKAEEDMVSRAALRWAARTLRAASLGLTGGRRVLALIASVLLDALFPWAGSDVRVEQVKAALLAGKSAFDSAGLSEPYSELRLIGFLGRRLTGRTLADLEAAVSNLIADLGSTPTEPASVAVPSGSPIAAKAKRPRRGGSITDDERIFLEDLRNAASRPGAASFVKTPRVFGDGPKNTAHVASIRAWLRKNEEWAEVESATVLLRKRDPGAIALVEKQKAAGVSGFYRFRAASAASAASRQPPNVTIPRSKRSI